MALPFALTALLTTHDPGAARLRKAARGASAMAIGALLVLALRTVTDVPAAAEISAGFLSLWATVGAVKDTTARARIVTTVALLVPGCAAALVACLLHPWPIARAIAFVVIAGAAAWTTRYGPRGSALGFFGFFTFFFAVIMRADLEALPVIWTLVAVAVVSALLVRLVLIPDRPGRELESLLRSLRACADDLLRVAVESSGEPERDRDRLGAAITRLSAATNATAVWQKNYDAARYTDVDDATLSLRVATLHLSCEQAALTVADAGAAPGRPDSTVAQSVSWVRDVLRSPSGAAPTVGGHDATVATLGVVASAAADLSAIEVRHRRRTMVPPAPSGSSSRTPKPKTPRPDTTRYALQVMVACSVAVVVGDLISASRWYWAVLSAFMVFNGMATRGAILTKAVKRVKGTVVGLAIGIAMLLIIGEHPVIQYVIVVSAVFFAFYLGAVSYTWTILFITVVLTNSYDLLGVLNRHIVEWRVEETLCGAVVGAAAAFLVLSTPTSPVLDSKLRAYFDALVDLAEAATKAITDSATRPDTSAILHAVRVLDEAESAVLDAATSAVFALSRSHRSMLRRLRPHLHETTRAARGLAWSVVGPIQDDTGVAPGGRSDDRDPLAELREAVDDTVPVIEHGGVRSAVEHGGVGSAVEHGGVGSAVEHGGVGSAVEHGGEMPMAEPRLVFEPADPDPVRQLDRVTAAVRGMAAAIEVPQHRNPILPRRR
ncbi:FUSC family protein [Gordonia aurantiaca]|uniref:FUSC family protein n=1 Tax=Gordonia sp. B21 TaxID=3151852 RepID=UPI0032665CF5